MMAVDAGRSRSGARVAARPVLGAATAAILLASAWFRVVDLGTIPGINGDEAWYGVQMESMLAGRPFARATPSGLPLNPIHVGPLALVLWASGPASWVLRAPSVASGLLLPVLAYLLLSRALDRMTALLATLLLASHPGLIAYARFGWDQSHAPLVGLLVLYFALRGRAVAASVALIVDLVVHPTNVFLAPVAVLALVAGRRAGGDGGPGVGLDLGIFRRFLAVRRPPLPNPPPQGGRGPEQRRGSPIWPPPPLRGRVGERGRWARNHRGSPGVGRYWLAIGATALGALVALIVMPVDPRPALRFLADLGRLLAGPTFYEYIAGPIGDGPMFVYDVLAWGPGLVLVAFGTHRMARQGATDRLAIGAGVLLGAGAIGLIGGADSIRPHTERYGMFLVVPSMVYLACCLRSLVPGEGGPRGSAVLALTLGACWASLWGFQRFYFAPFRETGGSSHPAFRTAAIEPKQAALAIILRDLASDPAAGRPIPILAEGWFVYWPIRFLAEGHPELAVTDLGPLGANERASAVRSALRDRGYVVGFVGGGIEGVVRASAVDAGVRAWDVDDRAGRPLIRVFRLEPGPSAGPPGKGGASASRPD